MAYTVACSLRTECCCETRRGVSRTGMSGYTGSPSKSLQEWWNSLWRSNRTLDLALNLTFRRMVHGRKQTKQSWSGSRLQTCLLGRGWSSGARRRLTWSAAGWREPDWTHIYTGCTDRLVHYYYSWTVEFKNPCDHISI